MADLNGIIEKAGNYLNDVVHLRIITAVGEFSAARDANSGKWVVQPGAGNNSAIMTDIDLVQGDIVSLVPQSLVSDSNSAIRDFHSTQVEKAEGIVRANIAALKGMIEVLVTAEEKNTGVPAVPAAGRPGAGQGGGAGGGGAAGGGAGGGGGQP